jgi:hypothetical protein
MILKFLKMCWFLDFVSYHSVEFGFIIKEIAILHNDGERCFNYFITGPKTYPSSLHSQTFNYQFDMHRLKWEFGDYEFGEAIMDIARKLGDDIVYLKGDAKRDFMSNILPRCTFVELQKIPSFRELNNCTYERCRVKHGNHCARRKVFELRHIFNQNLFV